MTVLDRTPPISAAFEAEIESIWADVRTRGRSQVVYVATEPGEVRLAHLRRVGLQLLATNPDAEVIVSLPSQVADRRALWAAGAIAIGEVAKTAAGYGDDVGLVTLTIGLAVGTGAVGLYSAALSARGDTAEKHVRQTLEAIDANVNAATIVILDDQRTEVARMGDLLRYFERPVQRPVLFLWGTDVGLTPREGPADAVMLHLVERQVRAGVSRIVTIPALTPHEFRNWLSDCDSALRDALEAVTGRDPTLAFEIYSTLRQSGLIDFDRRVARWRLDSDGVPFDLSFEESLTHLLTKLVGPAKLATARSLLELGSLSGRRFTVAAVCGAASHDAYESDFDWKTGSPTPDAVVDFLDDNLAPQDNDRAPLQQLTTRGVPGAIGPELWGYEFKSRFLARWLRQQIPDEERRDLAALAAAALSSAPVNQDAVRDELLHLYTLADDSRAEFLRLDHHVGTDTSTLAIHLALESDIDTTAWTADDFVESSLRLERLIRRYVQSVQRSMLQSAAELWLDRASRSGPNGLDLLLAALELSTYFKSQRTEQLAIRDRILALVDQIDALGPHGRFVVARSLSDVSRTLLANGLVEDAVTAATTSLHYVADDDLPDILWDVQILLSDMNEQSQASKAATLATVASSNVGQRSMSLHVGALRWAAGTQEDAEAAFALVQSFRPGREEDPRTQAQYSYAEGTLAGRLGLLDVASNDLAIVRGVSEAIGEPLLMEACGVLETVVHYLRESPAEVIVAIRLLWGLERDPAFPEWIPDWLPKLRSVAPAISFNDELERRYAAFVH